MTAPPALQGALRHTARACSLCAAAPFIGFGASRQRSGAAQRVPPPRSNRVTVACRRAVASGATLPRTHAFKFDDGLLEERVTLHAPRVEGSGTQVQPGATAAPQTAAAVAAAGAPGGAVLTAACALEYVYGQFRVVHRGALRATFSAALKARTLLTRNAGAASSARLTRGPARVAPARPRIMHRWRR